MVESRKQVHGEKQPREYCSSINEYQLYDFIEKIKPEYLVMSGCKISKSEYVKIIRTHMDTVKGIIIDGYPVRLESGLGTIGVEIGIKKVQLPSSRQKKDADKEYVAYPSIGIKITKEHLKKRISPYVNLNLLGVRLTSGTNQIMNNFFQDKTKYVLTGEGMHKYARRIHYARHK